MKLETLEKISRYLIMLFAAAALGYVIARMVF